MTFVRRHRCWRAPRDKDSIAIYFGSQSGTAEGFAHEIEQEAAEKGLGTAVIDLEDFDPEEFAKHKASSAPIRLGLAVPISSRMDGPSKRVAKEDFSRLAPFLASAGRPIPPGPRYPDYPKHARFSTSFRQIRAKGDIFMRGFRFCLGSGGNPAQTAQGVVEHLSIGVPAGFSG